MTQVIFGLREKIQYNKAMSKHFGWTPAMFGEDDFDENLINRIEQFQKNNHLEVDGLCGEHTFKKIFTEYEAKAELVKHQLKSKIPADEEKNKINFIDVGWSNRQIEIEWNKFIGLNDVGNLSLPPMTLNFIDYERKPFLFVIHHDACLSSKSCHQILIRRDLSIHFMIDNDGTIYQNVHLNHAAQHAGYLNMDSIGVEISNAVEFKYQNHYQLNGFGERPIINPFYCHSKNYGEILVPYPIQIEALKALMKSVCRYYSIPLECPRDANGGLLMDIFPPLKDRQFKGCVMHWHSNENKWDCAGLDLVKILKEIT